LNFAPAGAGASEEEACDASVFFVESAVPGASDFPPHEVSSKAAKARNNSNTVFFHDIIVGIKN
jgi:hypothetical protein